MKRSCKERCISGGVSYHISKSHKRYSKALVLLIIGVCISTDNFFSFDPVVLLLVMVDELVDVCCDDISMSDMTRENVKFNMCEFIRCRFRL